MPPMMAADHGTKQHAWLVSTYNLFSIVEKVHHALADTIARLLTDLRLRPTARELGRALYFSIFRPETIRLPCATVGMGCALDTKCLQSSSSPVYAGRSAALVLFEGERIDRYYQLDIGRLQEIIYSPAPTSPVGALKINRYSSPSMKIVPPDLSLTRSEVLTS